MVIDVVFEVRFLQGVSDSGLDGVARTPCGKSIGC